ncbi:leader peptidase (prepilin peptidase)/N-methyltransferase [Haloactinopolyspora alba]|uniref:Leader peptidase (Prepilin peptidase)/N-methyltransferase n=1 Tax=Haloactinopolyspora alba TaxID=648780 RepID=A0A2P8DXY0_9ACTN|nr:A24 family peptidase [Haloactinopolyspora alba]PSL02063.1 leader peptidase (prepilin peptidase)/N-methyltransferase [Haloactinopolyspora alba]
MTAALAAAGLLAGALLPWVIARIPDRAPADGDPAPTPYAELATAPRLALLLGVAGAVVWGLIGLTGLDPVELPAYLLVATLGVAMAYIDLREHRLPDWLTLPSLAGAAVLLAMAAATGPEWTGYGRAWAAAGVCFAFFLVLAILRPADLGLGDVKLAAVLGLLLGWVNWSTVLLGMFCGFLVGGIGGVALLVTGRATRRSSIPFGPAMLVGALVALLWVEVTTAGAAPLG